MGNSPSPMATASHSRRESSMLSLTRLAAALTALRARKGRSAQSPLLVSGRAASQSCAGFHRAVAPQPMRRSGVDRVVKMIGDTQSVMSPIVAKNNVTSARYKNSDRSAGPTCTTCQAWLRDISAKATAWRGFRGTRRSERTTLLHGRNGIGWRVQRVVEGLCD